METTDLIRRLHQHRTWVNQQLLAACGSLTPEQLRQQYPIGQGSLWRSLCHLLAAEHVWLEALQGREDAVFPGDVPGQLPGNQLGEGALITLAELTQRWADVEVRWQRFLSRLTPAALDEVVYRKSTSSGFGKRWPTRRGDILLHLNTHAQYTTAQIVNMLKQMGAATLPDVMLISLARQEIVEA